jgi:hypothetical protein
MTHAKKNWPALISLLAEAKLRDAGRLLRLLVTASCKDVRTCLLARSQSGDDLSGTRSNIVLDHDTAFRISRALIVVNPVFKVK